VTSDFVSQVDVAWSQDTFLAVWVDGSGYGPVVAGALLGETDTVVKRVTLDSSDMAHWEPVVASNDSEFLIAWPEYDTSGSLDRVRYARVTRSGVVLDTAPRLVAIHQESQIGPDIAWGDTSYLVAWHAYDDRDTGIYCNIIRRDGTRASDSGYLVSREQNYGTPAVSYDGRSFVVAWKRFAGTGLAPTDQIRVARVSPEGVVTDSAALAIGIDQIGQMEPMYRAVASVRDTTLFVWQSLRDSAWWVLGARLDSGLRTLDSAPIALSSPVEGYWNDGWAPVGISCAPIEDTLVVSWAGWLGPTDFHTPGRVVVCRRVTPGGALPETAAVMIPRAASGQYGPDVASDGADFMAVWEELRTDSTLFDLRLYYTRFSSSGTVLDSAGAYVDGPDVQGPAIGYGGG
jgi:hypothetical protein